MEIRFLIREQQRAEGIPNVEAEEIVSKVRKHPDVGIFWQRPFPHGPLSEFAYIAYKRERIVRDWKVFFRKNKQTAKDFAAKKEAVLQAHVKEWMNNEVSYLP